MPHRLHLKLVAQIEDADLSFGDLTVLVGPQATGKSILLQFHKLVVDIGSVLAEMKRYGLDWEKNLGEFLDVYFGEGMRGIWRPNSSTIAVGGEPVDLSKLIARQKRHKKETMFFIPAQRVLTLGKGWRWPAAGWRSHPNSPQRRRIALTGFTLPVSGFGLTVRSARAWGGRKPAMGRSRRESHI